MRRIRVFGNECPVSPVILSMAPDIDYNSTLSERWPAASVFRTASPPGLPCRNASKSKRRYRNSSADSYMNDVSGGKQAGARFEALCRKLRPDLLRFAFWLARDRALAEDVVQETLLRAWKAQDSLQDERAAKPWLLTIIRREYARTFERKRFVTVDLDALIVEEAPSLAATGDEDLGEMRAAIFKLPDDYREPLVLQVLMGYSTAEIAAELGLSNAAVLTRLFRARRQLRVLCGEDTSMDPDE
jgi:RNA polymerase sigma-70 factor (ECF subfamily)